MSLSSENEVSTSENAEDAESVSVWALLGGLVVGVGAIAAAPFTGGGSVLAGATLMASLSGAGTIVAAVGAGAVGAGLGASMSEKSQNDKYQKGIAHGLAVHGAKVKDLEQKLFLAAERYTEQNNFNDFIICLFAIGASVAACDGSFDIEEENSLKEFVAGASKAALPPGILSAIKELTERPPAFEAAMVYVEKLDQKDWPIIDDMLAIVVEADGVLAEEERKFLKQWAEYKASHSHEVLPQPKANIVKVSPISIKST